MFLDIKIGHYPISKKEFLFVAQLELIKNLSNETIIAKWKQKDYDNTLLSDLLDMLLIDNRVIVLKKETTWIKNVQKLVLILKQFMFIYLNINLKPSNNIIY